MDTSNGQGDARLGAKMREDIESARQRLAAKQSMLLEVFTDLEEGHWRDAFRVDYVRERVVERSPNNPDGKAIDVVFEEVFILEGKLCMEVTVHNWTKDEWTLMISSNPAADFTWRYVDEDEERVKGRVRPARTSEHQLLSGTAHLHLATPLSLTMGRDQKPARLLVHYSKVDQDMSAEACALSRMYAMPPRDTAAFSVPIDRLEPGEFPDRYRAYTMRTITECAGKKDFLRMRRMVSFLELIFRTTALPKIDTDEFSSKFTQFNQYFDDKVCVLFEGEGVFTGVLITTRASPDRSDLHLHKMLCRDEDSTRRMLELLREAYVKEFEMHDREGPNVMEY